MIDLHCHILPGIDDGPGALDESLQMALKAVAGGIRAVVATPHTGNGVYSYCAAEIKERVKAFKVKLAQNSIPLQVYPGSEVQLSPGLAGRLQQGEAMTLNSSRYVLLELPPTLLPEPCRNEIFNLRHHNFIPIIAHPERHPYLQHHMNYLADLVAMGALCQVTAQSLLGVFGRNVKTAAEQMLQGSMVHVMASDAHSSNGRAPALKDAVAAAARLLGSPEKARQLVTTVPGAIIADSGVTVEPPENLTENPVNPKWKRGGRSLFASISDLWS